MQIVHNSWDALYILTHMDAVIKINHTFLHRIWSNIKNNEVDSLLKFMGDCYIFLVYQQTFNLNISIMDEIWV